MDKIDPQFDCSYHCLGAPYWLDRRLIQANDEEMTVIYLSWASLQIGETIAVYNIFLVGDGKVYPTLVSSK